MPVLPIDTGRYGTSEMLSIFDERSRLQRILDVEAALALAQAEVGYIPRACAEEIARMASTNWVSLERVKEVEREVGHELVAVIKVLSEVCGSAGAYVHLGVTSNDILDTALALQLREAINLIESRLNRLEAVLMELAQRYKETITVGRTHGQHALPITLGFKFAVWMREVSRHIERLLQCRDRVLAGKISGAVGTQAGLGPRATEVQRLVMERLGLKASDITTQIVQRDRHAELVSVLALIASSLEKFALEIRELQRPEIGEVAEAFGARQIGSSTMPHKRNPVICERICGLARIVRSLVEPALENVPTWHERDLTQSSCERFVIPEACILVDYMLAKTIDVLETLEIDTERMRKNLELSQGRIMSEAVLLALVRKGMDRWKALELVRELAARSEREQLAFKSVLLESPDIRRLLAPEEVDRLLDPYAYLGTAIEQIEQAIEGTRKERELRKAAFG